MRKGVDQTGGFLQVVQFFGSELLGRLALRGDFSKPFVVSEQKFLVFLTSIHRASGSDFGKPCLDRRFGARSSG